MDRTAHEEYWSGASSAAGRTPTPASLGIEESRRLLREMLSLTDGIETAIDVGAGNGRHLLLLREVLPDVKLSALEINPDAVATLRRIRPPVRAYGRSVLRGIPNGPYDLVLAMGLLACVPPESLQTACARLRQACGRYLLLRDYVGPEIEYPHGASSIFRRDYVEYLRREFPDLSLRSDLNEDAKGELKVRWLLFSTSGS